MTVLVISPVALILVLLAALLHAGWNLLLHDTGDRIAALAVAGLVAGLVLLPISVVTHPWSVLPLIGLSALAETAYGICLAAAYRRGALSVAYPLGRGCAPLLVTLGGWLVLSQVPGPLALGGAVALAAGLAVVATAGLRSGQTAAVGFAVLTGCCIASYSLVDARAVQQTNPLGYLGPVVLLQGLLLFAVMRGDWSRLRRALRPGVKIAVGSTAAYLLVLFAFQLAAAGRVATLREVSVLIGLSLARDKPGWRLWAGAGLVVAGMVLTAW
jgi:drug/metabolite transporter (DMT)-like permease